MSVMRGDVYFVNLNPIQGREQAGHRPVLVVSIDAINRLPLVVMVVVGTSGANVKQDYATNVRVTPAESGMEGESVFLCFQVRSLDVSRFPATRAGKLTPDAMERIETAMRYCLGL
jgi:mRNA interferase MazF